MGFLGANRVPKLPMTIVQGGCKPVGFQAFCSRVTNVGQCALLLRKVLGFWGGWPCITVLMGAKLCSAMGLGYRYVIVSPAVRDSCTFP